MSDWKAAEEREAGNFLYIEEINANEGVKKRLTGISTTQSVEELKKAIAADLKNPEGWSSMSLAYCDQELSDLNASLSSYAIQQGDIIYFTRSVTPAVPPPPYTAEKTEIILRTVFVEHLNGRSLTLKNIPISWTIKQLREKLGQEKSLDVEDLRFLWGGKQLNDENTLEHYGLGQDCRIQTVMRLLGGARNL